MQRLLAVVAVFLAIGVFTTLGISRLEEHDPFCTSCHLAPEVTYHDRALAAGAVDEPFDVIDLSSYHYWAESDFRCIDCHRGAGELSHRLSVLLLAAEDTLTWAAGLADQTVEKSALPNTASPELPWSGPERYLRRPDILNAGCLNCHPDALTLVGFDNHFHNKLPAAQQAYEQTGQLLFPEEWGTRIGSVDLLQEVATVVTCLDCHHAHVEGFEAEYFLDRSGVLLPACAQCHIEAGRGPQDLVN